MSLFDKPNNLSKGRASSLTTSTEKNNKKRSFYESFWNINI